jgi:hypothetical protein
VPVSVLFLADCLLWGSSFLTSPSLLLLPLIHLVSLFVLVFLLLALLLQITDISSRLDEHLESIADAHKWGVIRSLAHCLRHMEPLQTGFMKRLRILFACHRANTRAMFVPCVLRLKRADEETQFDATQIQLQVG